MDAPSCLAIPCEVVSPQSSTPFRQTRGKLQLFHDFVNYMEHPSPCLQKSRGFGGSAPIAHLQLGDAIPKRGIHNLIVNRQLTGIKTVAHPRPFSPRRGEGSTIRACRCATNDSVAQQTTALRNQRPWVRGAKRSEFDKVLVTSPAAQTHLPTCRSRRLDAAAS